MGLSIDNTFIGNSSTPTTSFVSRSNFGNILEFQLKSKTMQNPEDNSIENKELKKKMQITSEIEGQYYCTYLIDDECEKVKLSQIPIDKANVQSNIENPIESTNSSSLDYSLPKDANLSFQLKQQLNLEGNLRHNTRDMTELINGKNNTNDILGTLKSIKHLVM
jgi:hypothetical protein